MKTVTLEEIAQRVAPRSAAQAQSVLASACEVMRDELSRGNHIKLPFLSVSVRDGGAPLASAPAPAEVQILPVAAPVPVAAPTVPAAPAAPPSEAFADVPVGQEIYHIVYAVPEKDFFTNITAQRLSGPKSKVTITEGRTETLDVVFNTIPDLLIVDSNIPEYRDVVAEVKQRRETSLVASVMILAEGMDPNRVEGLRVCEDEHIVEPFEFIDLVRLAESELARAIEERGFFQHEIHFQFQTTEACIERANEDVGNFLRQADGMSEETAAAMSVAFREAVDNAARHGNKNQERRIIDAIYLLDQEKATVTVEDEGEGFDTELYISRGKDGNAVAAARQRNKEGRAGGLGIMLMLKCVDDLQYNFAGNQIRLTKFVR